MGDDDDIADDGTTASVIYPKSGIVFNHLAKCGGSYVKAILNTSLLNASMVKFELESHAVTAADKSRFVIGMTRNPFDFYVSFWAFLSQDYAPSRFRRNLVNVSAGNETFFEDCSKCTRGESEEGKRAFRRFAKQVSDPDVGLLSLRFWGSYLSVPVKDFGRTKRHWQNAPGVRSYFEEHEAHGTLDLKGRVLGALDKFTDPAASVVDCWVATENINADLTKCLRQYEALRNDTVVDWAKFREATSDPCFKRNKSKHAKCSEMYDKETHDLVAQGDRHILHAFGMPDGCSPEH